MNLIPSASISPWVKRVLWWVFSPRGVLVVLLSVLFVAFVAVMFFKTAEGYIGQLLGLSGEDGLKNKILTFLGLSMGGVLLALQAVIANMRAKAMENTAIAQVDVATVQARATEEQATANKNTEKGQRQERLKNAIEHLGHDSVSIHLGGAYELFHLAQDTEELRQTVLDILCAHIRRTTSESKYREAHKSKPSEEVQSLLTLLFVQDDDHHTFKGLHTNLQGGWLNGVDLSKARLEKAVLTEAYLQGATLIEAQLQGAYLIGAQMQKANFTEANMQRVSFHKAHMQRADLSNACLHGSILNDARLHGANLIGANLQESGLNDTYLQGAYLEVTKMQMASLAGAHMQGAFLRMAKLHGVNLRNTQMQGAFLHSVQLHGAEFSSLQNRRHFNEMLYQGINPEPAHIQGVRDFGDEVSGNFAHRMRDRIGKENDLSGVTFAGGLSREYVNSIVKGLSEVRAKELREILEPHIDQPASHELPENNGAITEPYTEEEAEKWIAEYEAAMLEVPEEDDS